MTIWINKDFEPLDVVLEPNRPGVVTVLAVSVDHLLPLSSLCPEPPFLATGGFFRFGVHIPISSLEASEFKHLVSNKFAECLTHLASPEAPMYFWVGWREVGSDGDESEDSSDTEDSSIEWGNGYIWPDSHALIMSAFESEGWQQLALVPCYRELLGLESAGSIAGLIDFYYPVNEEPSQDPPDTKDVFGGES